MTTENESGAEQQPQAKTTHEMDPRELVALREELEDRLQQVMRERREVKRKIRAVDVLLEPLEARGQAAPPEGGL